MVTQQSDTKLEPVLSRLRAETRELHAAIEKSVDVLRPDLSQEQYLDLLQRLYGFYRPLEAQWDCLSGLKIACPDYRSRKKAALLEKDLMALGMTPDSIAALPCCTALSALPTPAHALGCLYVVEGATLGGAIIARHIFATLNLSQDSGCAFFTSYGDQRGAMWKRLSDLLNALAEQQPALVIESARKTFVSFNEWLTGSKPACSKAS